MYDYTLCVTKYVTERFQQSFEQGTAKYSDFWYIYYPDNKPLRVGFNPHITHFLWLFYVGKLSNRDNHESLNCWYSNAKISYVQNYNYNNLLTYYATFSLRRNNNKIYSRRNFVYMLANIKYKSWNSIRCIHAILIKNIYLRLYLFIIQLPV